MATAILEMKLINGLLPMQSHFQSNNYTIEQPHFQSNILSNQWYIARIFQIGLVPVGYEELAAGLEPIRNGEIF